MHPPKTMLYILGIAALTLAPSISARASTKPMFYHAVGIVDAVQNRGKVLVIEHEDIPSLMKGMTMAFEVSDTKLSEGIHAGDHIRFTLEREGHRFPVVAVHRFIPKKSHATVKALSARRRSADPMKGTKN
ncbi:MAG: copper-binding protein [bacterium]